MSALSRQKIQVSTDKVSIIVFGENTRQWAISLAKDFRSKGKNIELIRREAGKDKADYVEHGKRSNAVSLMYLEEDFVIAMINLKTGEEKLVDCK